MLKKFLANTGKPGKSLSGRICVNMMNKGHSKVHQWGISQMEDLFVQEFLDIGCGGGVIIATLLEKFKGSRGYGIDYSETSVEVSKKYNRKAVEEKWAMISQANVICLPFYEEKFDLVTAFETVYFWPDLEESFREVYRVMNKNGIFLITNTMANPDESEFWKKRINMNLYSGSELNDKLFDAGFRNIIIHRHPNGKWISVIAEKTGGCCE